MKVLINEEVKRELNEAIDTINMGALSYINESVRVDLVNNGMKDDEIEGLLHKEISIDNISEDNKYVFLNALYKNLKNKKLNPELFLESEDGSLDKTIAGAIHNINTDSLDNIKSVITKKLSERNISESTIRELFSKETYVKELDEKSQFFVINALYEAMEDESLNPLNFFDKELVEEYKKKPSKDNMPQYYYDYKFKLKFSNKYNEKTKKVVLALFRKSKPFEDKFDKDICNFNIKELKEFFKSLKSKTIRSLQNQISTIETYVKFAQLPENREGKTELKVNYATAFDSRDKLEELLYRQAVENMILDEEDVMIMSEDAENAQDGVIPALLFTGVSHKNEFEELINLTINDVDLENKKIKLKDRTLTMNDTTARLVESAYKQEVYYSINGESARKYKITEGENILRGLRKKLQVKAQIISQRIARISKMWAEDSGEDENFVNATTLSYSGQIHLAKQMLDSGMFLDDVVNEVLHTFGVPNNESSRFYLKTRIQTYMDAK